MRGNITAKRLKELIKYYDWNIDAMIGNNTLGTLDDTVDIHSALRELEKRRDNEVKIMETIIDKNPIKKLLPMTHKSNHGIDLSHWKDAFRRKGIETKLQSYQHCVSYNLETNEPGHYFPATELVLTPNLTGCPGT
jgi:hypothetical protein